MLRPHIAARLALLLAAGLSAGAGAESVRRDFHFRITGSDQGLAQNSVTALLQDRLGYIWVGTQAGLQRYDGYAFRTFEHSSDNPAAQDEPVSALVEDAEGVIWIGTADGVERLDPAASTITRVSAAAGATADLASVRALAADPGHGIWVGTDAGLARVDASGTRLEAGPALPRLDARAAHVRQLRRADDGTLWIASSAGLFRLAPQTDAVERVGADVLDDVAALGIDHAHRLYAGSYDGLYRLDGSNAAPRRVWPEQGTHGVTAIAEDASGRLWLAVPHEGLVGFDPEHGEAIWLHSERNLPGTLPAAPITELLVDRSGLLWVGTAERGLARMDPAGSIFQTIVDAETSHDAQASNNVHAIFEDAAGGLWLGTDDNGLKRYDPVTSQFERVGEVIARAFATAPSKHPDLRVVVPSRRGDTHPPAPPPTIPELNVTALAGTGQGRLWVATSLGIALFDPARRSATVLPIGEGEESLADAEVRSVLSANDGRLWLGTAFNGLARYDAPADRWQVLRADAGNPRLSSNTVLALHQDKSGMIWVGTLSGLDTIDAAGAVHVYRPDATDPRSLAGNIVRAIHESADGKIWIGTQAGLNRVDGRDGDALRFTRWQSRDGLPSGTICAIGEDAMGRLWLSTNKGLAAFDPSTEKFRAFNAADGLKVTEFNSGAYAALRD
ncbi:MAG TPA: two-component regulator propeller domain-containing protein, partial [Rhodanobacteraceae bacterium]